MKRNEEAQKCYEMCVDEIKKHIGILLNEYNIPREDAALLLPLGMETKVVDKRNLRNLLDMSQQRLCNRANWEYRALMKDVLNELKNISEEWEYIVDNYFGPKCKKVGYCTERKSCGLVKRKGE